MSHTSPIRTRAILFAMAAFAPVALFATSPVIVWDGAAEDSKFDNLTRTVGDNTYTLNLNANTIAADGSYVKIGSDSYKAGVTITAANSVNPAVTNGFGTSGSLTVVMRCSNLNLSDNAFRAIIGLLSAESYFPSNNHMCVSILSSQNSAYGIGRIVTTSGLGWRDFSSQFPSHDYSSCYTSVFSTGEQTLALTYDSNQGIVLYNDGERAYSNESWRYSSWKTPAGIALGGPDIDGMRVENFSICAQTGMKIHAVAVFASALSDSEVAAYMFPSEIAPPSGETHTYTGALPTVSGDVFTDTKVPTWVTDPERWNGTIWLKNIPASSGQGNDFNPNLFGNTNSTVRLTGVRGYFARIDAGTGITVSPTVELVDEDVTPAVEFTNGYGRGNVTTLAKLAGTGTMKCDTITGGSEVIRVRNWSNFTGTLGLSKGKVVSFDDKETPDGGEYAYANDFCYVSPNNESWGVVYVATNVTLAIPQGRIWTLGKGIHVAGVITYKSLYRRSDATVVKMLTGGEITEEKQELLIPDRLEPTLKRLSGDITFAYDGVLPPDRVFSNEIWTGKVKISSVAKFANLNLGKYGNAKSTIELSGIGATEAYFSTNCIFYGKLVLTDNGNKIALALSSGYSASCAVIGELSGSGTMSKCSGLDSSPGITINVMTNFTGTLALTNMTVTLGTTNRAGRVEGHISDGYVTDTADRGKLFIDPDAKVSVPAGFALWEPLNGGVIDGHINFTTDEVDYDSLVLLKGAGKRSKVTFGSNARITINGEDYDRSAYMIRFVGPDMTLRKKRRFFSIVYR